MQKSILNIENQEFINSHLEDNISSLLFKKHTDITLDVKVLVEQIEAKKRCKKKLPTWFNSSGIIYPNKLNIEQTSSEITANYKSTLVKGSSVIDITGGFGVDCYYFSKYFKSVIHCEINEKLSKIVTHNFRQLQATNIDCKNINGIDYLNETNKSFDCIYIDPSRRHESKGKVFFLNDCQPNVPKHLNLLFSRSKMVLIKTSPLLDISVGLSELKNVKSIHIVAINNEVKELLWVLEENYNQPVNLFTVNIKKEKQEIFNFNLSEESNCEAIYNEPLSYLYEPNSAILKAGAFNIISNKLNLYKLQKHAHLYTSKNLISFPGRIFKIEKVISYNKKEMKKANIKQANITIRNFPETVKQIRNKFNIKEGGDTYLFFTTNNLEERITIKCKKL